MNKNVRPFALVFLAAMPLLAGAQVHGDTGRPGSEISVENGNLVVRALAGSALSCGVTDLPAFESFIAGHPTPLEFHAAYSCVTLALPGDVTTREIRSDNSRYFADLDAHGRIVGGHFQ